MAMETDWSDMDWQTIGIGRYEDRDWDGQKWRSRHNENYVGFLCEEISVRIRIPVRRDGCGYRQATEREREREREADMMRAESCVSCVTAALRAGTWSCDGCNMLMQRLRAGRCESWCKSDRRPLRASSEMMNSRRYVSCHFYSQVEEKRLPAKSWVKMVSFGEISPTLHRNLGLRW